jgi:hypothetical protein
MMNVSNFRKSSVLIWMIYIEFEARYGRPLRAKELVFRAMRECPWAKGMLFYRMSLILDLAMMAFGMLRNLFDPRELGRVYNVVMEKEIRVHGEVEGLNDIPRREIELPVDESSDEQ